MVLLLISRLTVSTLGSRTCLLSYPCVSFTYQVHYAHTYLDTSGFVMFVFNNPSTNLGFTRPNQGQETHTRRHIYAKTWTKQSCPTHPAFFANYGRPPSKPFQSNSPNKPCPHLVSNHTLRGEGPCQAPAHRPSLEKLRRPHVLHAGLQAQRAAID